MFVPKLRFHVPYLLLLSRLGVVDTVPTELIETGEGDASGACSLCQVKTLKDADGGARLELYYDDEELAKLHANIALTCWLADGEYRTQVIEGVDLVAGQTSWHELGSDCSRDVEYLEVEVTPARG